MVLLLSVMGVSAQTSKKTTQTRTRQTQVQKKTTRKQVSRKTVQKTTRKVSKKVTTKKKQSDQTQTSIRQLRNKKEEVQNKIVKNEQQLAQTNAIVKKGLAELSVLNGQVEAQQNIVSKIQQNIETLTSQIDKISEEIKQLQEQLEDKKTKYRRSVQYLYSNRKIENKLLFILSADNFTQALRRYHYVHNFAKHQRIQGKIVQQKEEEVQNAKKEFVKNKDEKKMLLNQNVKEKAKLQSKQTEQQKVVASLKNKQKQIQNVLAADKKEMDQLNAKINYYVQLAIEQERKAREERERKAREAEARRKRESAAGKTTQSNNSNNRNIVSSNEDVARPEPVPTYKTNDKEYKIGSNFLANKGRLPVPITGPYVISSHYGQYKMKGVHGVLDNKGVYITGKGEANARCIFDGEVSNVFSFGNTLNVLIRHGNYISLYCNLSSVSVSKGQRVSTRQSVGAIAVDANGHRTLHFQLRKESSILNPERWLAL